LLSEPWNVNEWHSPSLEEDVKTRVRRRAKAIQRWRRVPPMVAVVLVAALVVPQLPETQSTSTVRVAGEGTDGGAVAESAPEDEADSSSPSSTSTSSTTTTTDRRIGVTLDEPVTVESHVGGAPPRIVDRTPGKPLVVDETGDSWDRDCGDPFCPEPLYSRDVREKRPQPALDLVSVDVRCAAKVVAVRVALLDPDAVSEGSPRNLTYVAAFAWDDGPSGTFSPTPQQRDGWVEILFTRSMETGELTTEVTVGMFADETTPALKKTPIAGARGRIEGGSLVAEWSFDAWAAAAEATYSGRSTPAPGTIIKPPYATSRKDDREVDWASEPDYEVRYRLCG
jgi:hypothetical protein